MLSTHCVKFLICKLVKVTNRLHCNSGQKVLMNRLAVVMVIFNELERGCHLPRQNPTWNDHPTWIEGLMAPHNFHVIKVAHNSLSYLPNLTNKFNFYPKSLKLG